MDWLPRQRLEWETRNTINNRMWADTMDAGPKAVTATMLAGHPTAGAFDMMPASSRKDNRPYHNHTEYFPDSTARVVDGQPIERAPLPPKSVFLNHWISGYDFEGGDIARELRGTVKENNRFLTQDVSARMAGRTFENQWIPDTVTRQIAERKIQASELLRPAQDDFRQSYVNQTPQRPEHRDG